MPRQRGRRQPVLIAGSQRRAQQQRHAHGQYGRGGRQVRAQAVTGIRRTTGLPGGRSLIARHIETVRMRCGSLRAGARRLDSSPGRPGGRPVKEQDDQQKQTQQRMAVKSHDFFRVRLCLWFFKSDSPSLAGEEIGPTLGSLLLPLEGITVHTRTLTSLLAALALNTSWALAQTPPPGPPPPATPPHAHSDPDQGPPGMAGMGGHMKKMQDLMARIHASKNPAERQQLLQEHRKLMQEQMNRMHGAGGMHGPGPGQHGMRDHVRRRDHQMMQRRMDHLELMMEQMLQHQDAEHDNKSAK